MLIKRLCLALMVLFHPIHPQWMTATKNYFSQWFSQEDSWNKAWVGLGVAGTLGSLWLLQKYLKKNYKQPNVIHPQPDLTVSPTEDGDWVYVPFNPILIDGQVVVNTTGAIEGWLEILLATDRAYPYWHLQQDFFYIRGSAIFDNKTKKFKNFKPRGTEAQPNSSSDLPPAIYATVKPKTITRDDQLPTIKIEGDSDEWRKIKKAYNDLRALKSPRNDLLFRPSLFHHIMGFTENYYKIAAPQIDSNKKSLYFPHIWAISQSSSFKTIRISELQIRSTPHNSQEKGSVKFIDGYEIAAENKITGPQNALEKTDIRYLQALKENRDAVFQIASTFNCLEGGMAHERLEQMQYRAVQGEEASLATMAGAIVRKYQLFHKWSDVFPASTRLLDALRSKLTLTNDDSNVQEIKKELNNNDIPSFAIGWHEDVVVSSGYYPADTINSAEKKFLHDYGFVAKHRQICHVFNSMEPHLLNQESPHTVNQVFTSAINMDKHVGDRKWENSAKIALKAAYEGTIRAAYIHNKKKVFLTTVGTGAFKNEYDWVADALNTDSIAKMIVDGGLQVYIVLYYDQKNLQPNKKREFLKELHLFKEKIQTGLQATVEQYR